VDLDALEVDAFLADSVVVAEGKLYAQGAGWDTLVAGAFPIRHPRLGVGVLLRVPWTATNQMHKFSVRIVDPDENKIALGEAPPGVETLDGKVREFVGQFNLGRPPFLSIGDSQIIPIALNIDGIEFAEPSTYSVVVAVDDVDMRRLPIRVKSLVQMPGGVGPSQIPRVGA
jgi:hypothetical protein